MSNKVFIKFELINFVVQIEYHNISFTLKHIINNYHNISFTLKHIINNYLIDIIELLFVK